MWPFRKRERSPEVNSGQQMVMPTNLRLPSRDDRIRQMIRHEMFRARMASEDHETFEEADDFELDTGDGWTSPYEDDFDPDFDQPTPAKPDPAPEPTPAPAPSQPDNPSAA